MDLDTEEVKVGPYVVSIIRDDHYIGACLRRGYEWDGWMRQDLPLITRQGMDILDIGGNIGWNSLMFSEYGPVHTFEPLFHKVVQKNIDQNSTKWPVTSHPYGLSDSEKSVEFWMPLREGPVCNYGGARISDPTTHEKLSMSSPLKRLDDVYTGTPCLMKIDVEGHELQVLKGAEQTIRKHMPNLYVEIFDFENGPVTKFLKEIGYKEIYPRPEHNYLFISPGSPS